MCIRTIRAGMVLLAGTLSAHAQEPVGEPAPANSAEPAITQSAAPAQPAAVPEQTPAAEPTPEADPAPAEPASTGEAPAIAVEAVRPEGEENPEPAPQSSGVVALDAVEVTAQRRKQKLQDVPIAVTAMTRDQVESRGIQRLDDLNSLAPGLQISRAPANSTISQITIRGSSQINPAIYWDPAAGVYLDGVYIGKGQGSIFDIVDLAGVEVLRGPQGTLYGRNTIGGTINFVTREPSGNFGGSAAMEFGNYNARVLRAALDLPRFGGADLTLAARTEQRDGWVTTSETSPVSEMNNRNNQGFTLGAIVNLSEALGLSYRFDHSDVDQTNTYLQLYRYDRPEAAEYVYKTRQTYADIDSPSLEQSRVSGHALTLSWSPDPRYTLKSISGYRKVQWTDYLDLDGSPQMIAHTRRLTDYQQLSQDLNLSGQFEQWNFTGGLFYFEDDGYTNNPQTFYEGVLNFDSQYGTETKAWAAYGQADWQIGALTLTAGLRYTRETKQLDRTLGFSPVAGGPFIYYIDSGFRTPEAEFTGTTPMFSAAWRISEQLNTYVRYAEGFKSGGFNGEYSNLQDTPDDGEPDTTNDNQAATNTPFRPERQASLELGVKTSFLDGRALFNIAAFHNKLTDLQISTFVGQGAAASTISNAGKATVKGIELEAAVIPFEGTQLRANFATLNPKYTEFIDAGENVAGNRAFVHAPKRSYNLVLDSRLFTGGWGELRAVADYVWTDDFYTYPYQLAPDPNPPGQQKQEAEDTKVPAYGLFNARLSLGAIPVGGMLGEITLWGRNLADEDSASNFIDFGPGLFASLTVVNFVEPRTVGMSFALRW